MGTLILNVLGFILPAIFKRIMPNKSPEEINAIIQQVQPEIAEAIETGLMKAQASVSAAEASSIYKFVAYARAALIWICISCAVYGLIVMPFMNQFFPHVPMFNLNTSQMIMLLEALLGVSVPIHVAHYVVKK